MSHLFLDRQEAGFGAIAPDRSMFINEEMLR